VSYGETAPAEFRLFGGRSATTTTVHHGGQLWRRQRRDAATAVPTRAEAERGAVEARGDELADERQRVQVDAEGVGVVQETGAGTIARPLTDETRRVDGGAVEHRRRKTYTAAYSQHYTEQSCPPVASTHG